MAIIRLILGKIILFFNWLFTPKSILRAPQEQATIDALTASLTLYHYEACPFCVKVRRAMKRLSLTIETRDVKRMPGAKEQLLAGGGDLKVPCLRVQSGNGEVEWMYESADIINYLNSRFSPQTAG
jgi:glutaredoxin